MKKIIEVIEKSNLSKNDKQIASKCISDNLHKYKYDIELKSINDFDVERPIGTKILYKNNILIIIYGPSEGNRCCGCMFKCGFQKTHACFRYERKDDTCIIYKKVSTL